MRPTVRIGTPSAHFAMPSPSPTERLPREALAAVLGAFVVALLIACGASVWLPLGRAGVDHLMLPSIAFPLVWVGCGVGLYAAPNSRRARLVVGGLALLSVATLVIEALR